MGPGQYSPERGDTLTKTKMANVNFGTSESRATIVRKGEDVGPGQYDDGKRFGSETRTFTIGEKRAERVREGMGPGAYSPERGDALTKTKTVNINMGSSPSRASLIQKESYSVGPGQYDDGKSFGKETKTWTIGEKRAERFVETMGPGAYSPERGDALTKTKMANVNFGTS